MDARNALRFSLYYHALALVASLVGIAIAAGGIYVGLAGSFSAISLTDPLSLLTVSLSNLAIAGGAIVLGVYVRRVGRTAARIKADTSAVEEHVDVPSTSVISRKVAGEVSTQVADEVGEAIDAVTSDEEFNFGGIEDSDPEQFGEDDSEQFSEDTEQFDEQPVSN